VSRFRRSGLSILVAATMLTTTSVWQASASPGLVTTDLNGGITPEDLAEALAGAGVAVSNVTYVGANVAAGSFSGGTGIVGFEEGILLSSGDIANVVGPNEVDDITTNNDLPGDEDLTALSGFPTNDASVLEFDFVPDAAAVAFQYVFASDEYNEFVNSDFNDVFGFFVNGSNCATIDGDPVSINTINNGNPFGTDPRSHPEFYVNNDLDDGGGTIDTEMDGLTTVLACESAVTPGATNHMKLAIADASDFSLDSAVFLQAGSLTTGEPLTTAKAADSPTSPAGGSNGYTIEIANPNAFDATLTSITDTLPAGFTYVTGSSTGVTTADPAIEGQLLTWSGSFTVPEGGSVSLHFGVTVSTEPGEYLNEAGGTADDLSVQGTGPTAPVTVTGDGDTQDHVIETVGDDGGTVMTTGEVTPDNPVQTTVIVPPGTGGGTVEITEEIGNDAIDCAGKTCFWPQRSFITSPSATMDDPLQFIFTVDASVFPDGVRRQSLRVFHGEDRLDLGVVIRRCTNRPFVRCLDRVVRLGDGDIRYFVNAVENGKHRG
jgi:uncharacterized repeat protein (TIGR01451 family)